MDYRVTFSKRALRELTSIVKFIAKDNPDAARELGEKLLDQAISLSHFPSRHTRHDNRNRVRKMPATPYLIYYSINENTHVVTILHFWHSARQNPIP